MTHGLMVSQGDLWKRQRRMIQPAFNHESIGPLTKMIAAVNSELLRKWQLAARRNESVNVTRDVSGMTLEAVLRFILGDDYELVGFHFDLLSQEQARNMAFARSFRALGKIILQVIDRRRKDPATPIDALTMLMQARDPQSGQSMQDRQIVDEILTLIVAGHETTAATLNWTLYLISQHPEVEQRLSNELNTLYPALFHPAASRFMGGSRPPQSRSLSTRQIKTTASQFLGPAEKDFSSGRHEILAKPIDWFDNLVLPVGLSFGCTPPPSFLGQTPSSGL